ncbi:hypothetical protein [Rathayibacter sp. PhB151]|uniref:hypothetical protein n=1 Tax=Rathayibacter sp. PhB151 TaxID=2485189 RepID=UPI00106241F8|nr:hypothetical protein [Rathayibacter sp. PhB151]
MFSRSSATRAGRRRTGTQLAEREGTVSVLLNRDGSPQDLRAAERAWAKVWSYDEPATLEVQVKDEPNRYLSVYFDGGPLDFTRDPDNFRFYRSDVAVIADDPLWRGPQQEFLFDSNEPDADFFGRDAVHGQDGGPDYWLSAAYAPITKPLRNPGNVPAPVRWVLDGPISGFDTIIDGRSVAGSFPIPAGQTLRIDSDSNTALLSTGAQEIDMWRQLTSWQFSRLAPGQTSTVSIEREGTGSARLEWTPQYRQARG